MCVWDETSGKVALSDTVSLWADMPRKRLIAALEDFTGMPLFTDDPEHAAVVSTGAFPFLGAQSACLCTLRRGRLHCVEFALTGGTAAKQRETLFRFLNAQDPCADAMRSVLLRYPFGTAWIAADPRSGDATLRITYAVKE
ncbi:MAG: hypothetical protein ABIG45_07555 [Bacillota bacterium]